LGQEATLFYLDLRGAIPPLPQYAFMAWCSFKAQGHTHTHTHIEFILRSLYTMGPDSPTSKVTGYGLDDWGSYPSKIIFLLAIMNTPAPTQAEKGPFPI
jgi:hypothetical protein